MESTFHDSIPFLLFAPDEFRDELIMRLRGLYQSCNPRATDNFNEELKRIKEMSKDFDFGEMVNIHIFNLQTKLKPFNQTLTEHSIRLQELEKQVKYLTRYNKNSAKIKSVGEVAEKIDPQGIDGDNLSYVQEDCLKKEPNCISDQKDASLSSNEVPLPSNEVPLPLNEVTNQDKRKPRAHTKDIISNCLRSSNIPLTRTEICNKTGLNGKQINNGLYRLKQQIKCEEGKTQKTKKTYLWVGNE